MYQDLGFSLKPPAWLRKVAGTVIHGTTATIPTPTGVPITVDLGNPASVDAAKRALAGTKLSTSVGQPAPTFAQQADAAVSGTIPGGWLTLVGAGLAALLFLRRR